ncbi:hypothetical protein K458DRAFT_398584 [Lentithecium fluviatile CBS 122367]|uniref:Uncharacterized protein n=1 Tax=Lentithecium fluviatile CBS 122367 TaxID=1168545 RepID=A0A6G1JQ38_9PLEO|nr:hypothetical protein K458DRAFT_398584 [Lentithecium fluviatile CBS 122367]
MELRDGIESTASVMGSRRAECAVTCSVPWQFDACCFERRHLPFSTALCKKFPVRQHRVRPLLIENLYAAAPGSLNAIAPPRNARQQSPGAMPPYGLFSISMLRPTCRILIASTPAKRGRWAGITQHVRASLLLTCWRLLVSAPHIRDSP